VSVSRSSERKDTDGGEFFIKYNDSMLIGITGTDGSGKGEKRIHGASQDLEQLMRKVYRACKAPVPNRYNDILIKQSICS
jgi:hypothetical protein